MRILISVLILFLCSFSFGQGNIWQAVNVEACGDAQLEYDSYFHSITFHYPSPVDTIHGYSYVEYATQRVQFCDDDSTKMLYLIVEVDQDDPEVCICTDTELLCIAVHRTAEDTLFFKLVDWNISIHEEKHDRLVKKIGKAYQNWERNAKNRSFQKKAFAFENCDQFVKNSSL